MSQSYICWQPNAEPTILRARAKLLTKIREFFAARDVLEVETPLLCSASIPDPNIHSFTTQFNAAKSTVAPTLYLQTSPEFSMKRLIAAGSGSIYQICKAFRDEEHGRMHNPEFTILEWYRVGFDHYALMDEMDELLQYVAGFNSAQRITYKEAFVNYLNIDPHASSIDELKQCAINNGLKTDSELTHDEWLNILLSNFIEPNLGRDRPIFIYNYPASQAALAKINGATAERFEVYINGIELANGFNELNDATQQRQRFIAENRKREKLKLPLIPIDEKFLAALDNDFPQCAGVALGLDRLLMLLTNSDSIANTLTFAFDNI